MDMGLPETIKYYCLNYYLCVVCVMQIEAINWVYIELWLLVIMPYHALITYIRSANYMHGETIFN